MKFNKKLINQWICLVSKKGKMYFGKFHRISNKFCYLKLDQLDEEHDKYIYIYNSNVLYIHPIDRLDIPKNLDNE